MGIYSSIPLDAESIFLKMSFKYKTFEIGKVNFRI